MELAQRAAAGNVVEARHTTGALLDLALQLLAARGYLACLTVSVQNVESVAGGRRTVQTEHQCRCRRACLRDALVALVEHGAILPCLVPATMMSPTRSVPLLTSTVAT